MQTRRLLAITCSISKTSIKNLMEDDCGLADRLSPLSSPLPNEFERKVAKEMFERVYLADYTVIADKAFAGKDFEAIHLRIQCGPKVKPAPGRGGLLIPSRLRPLTPVGAQHRDPRRGKGVDANAGCDHHRGRGPDRL
jgi:hypothetical protein